MKVSDFRRAMRPKKYLTRDFVVYQDPKRLAARSEMQAGGVVEREGKFRGIREGGPLPKGYGTVKEFFEKAKQKGISLKSVRTFSNNSKRFTEKYDIKTKVNPYNKSSKIYDLTALDNQKKVNEILKAQVKGPAKKTPEIKKFIEGSAGKLRRSKEYQKQKKEMSGYRVEKILEGDRRTVKSHLASLKNELQTPKMISYTPAETNVEFNRGIEREIDQIIKAQNKLIEKKPSNWKSKFNKLNEYGIELAAASGGEKSFSIRNYDGSFGYNFGGKTGVDTGDIFKGLNMKDIEKIYKKKEKTPDELVKIKLFEMNKDALFKNISKTTKPRTATEGRKLVKNVQKNLVQGINESSPKDLTDFISTLAPGCKLKYADGGRVNYSTGSDCYNRGLEMLKQASQGDKTTAQKVGQSLKQFRKATGKLARFLELPLEIALEGLLIGWDSTFNAKPLDESIKDNGIVTRALFSDFQTSGEQDRAANIAKQNPQAAKYVEAKEALDKYNKLKLDVNVNKDNLRDSNLYQNAVKEFEEYENEIEDKIPQYKAMLTPGSPEYEAFKEDRIQLETDRIEKTYGDAQEMEELMQPFEGATDVADIQKDKAEELQGNIENVSSVYNFGPTFEEVKKRTLPELYKRTDYEKNPRTDAAFEQLLKKQYDENLKLFSRPEFSEGGLTRRGFLKVIGALTALAAVAKTGVMKLTSPVAKKVLKDAPQGTPDWFAPLVEKIMKEGINISDKAATIERQVVKELKTPDGTYTITETPDTGEIIVSVDTGAGVNDFPVDFTMTPNRITGVADDGTPITEFGEFNIVESRPEGRQVSPDGDYDIELEEYVTSDLDDAASDWHSVEKFATGKTDEIAQKKKQDGKEFIEKNPNEDIVNRYGDYDPPEPEPDYD